MNVYNGNPFQTTLGVKKPVRNVFRVLADNSIQFKGNNNNNNNPYTSYVGAKYVIKILSHTFMQH